MEARYLSKEVHLLRNSHPGCFCVWNEVKQEVVVAAGIEPLSILPGVVSFLQGQQSHGPGRRGEGKDDVLQSPCEISPDAAAELPRSGADLPAQRQHGASSHSEGPIAGARGHPEAAMVRTRVHSGAITSPEAAIAGSWPSSGGAERKVRIIASIARGPSVPRKWVETAVVPAQVKVQAAAANTHDPQDVLARLATYVPMERAAKLQ